MLMAAVNSSRERKELIDELISELVEFVKAVVKTEIGMMANQQTMLYQGVLIPAPC
jgi:hypothetical protein